MLPSLALIGVGAIAELFYLPAIGKLRNRFGQIWLVDPRRCDPRHMNHLDAAHVKSLSEIQGGLSYAIVAAPNALHLPLALQAIESGAHVLVEKPFVTHPTDGLRLIDAAQSADRTVAVNQTRRLYPMASKLREVVADQSLGQLRSIQHIEGVKLEWPFESGAAFAPNAYRTGVIMDFGVHVLDFYHFLMQPEWQVERAIHDGFAGPEGLAEMFLRANDVQVHIRLSRHQLLANTGKLMFERGSIEFSPFEMDTFTVVDSTGVSRRVIVRDKYAMSYNDLGVRLIENFIAGVDGREAIVCDATSSLPVIELLDDIYERADRYPSAIGAV